MSISPEQVKASIKELNLIDRKVKQYREAIKQLNNRKTELKETIDTFMAEKNLAEINVKSENTVIKKIVKKKVQGTNKKFIQQRVIEYCHNRGFNPDELLEWIYSPEYREQTMVEDIKFNVKK